MFRPARAICGNSNRHYDDYPLGDFSTGVKSTCSLRAVGQTGVYRGNLGDWKISDLPDTSLDG